MSDGARLAGLVAAITMAAFSFYMYLQTGDWVAAIFVLGSVAYGVFFWSSRKSGGGS